MDLAALKDQINRIENELPYAPSQKAAFDKAMSAAELSLKALKFAKDPQTTKSLSAKVDAWIKQAERIKFDSHWKPSSNVSSATQRNQKDHIDVAKIIKFKEPVSSRKLPISEEILLLKASQLNGFKFPPWTHSPKDSEFEMPASQLPFTDKPELSLSSLQLEAFDGWKRPAEALPPPAWSLAGTENSRVTMLSPRKIDLVQDAATDCSVVASLCAVVARGERGHARILGSVIYPYDSENACPKMSPNGKYIAKLNFNGTYRKVEIDDRLPVSKTSRVLHVIDRHNPGLLWPALLEKAYLKVRGSYDFPGSNSGTDLWILSGWIPEQVFLQSDDTIPNLVWDRIHKSHLYGDVLVTMGTGKISNRTEREIGLAGEHDYAVLNVREVDGQKLMLVKNPWCEGTSWKGSVRKIANNTNESSEGDDEVLPSSRDLLNADDDLTPGTFWMDLNSVIQYFDSIYLNWNPGLFQHRQDIHFSWDLSSASPHGRSRSYGGNPQFQITAEKSSIVWVLLSRHFRDTGTPQIAQQSSEFISLHAFENKGAKVFLGDGAFQRGPFVDSPQTLLRMDDLVPGKAYTVVPVEQDLAPVMHTFSLSVFSPSRITINEAPNKYHHQKIISASWTTETAGGNAHSPTYFQNPQFRIAVGHKTSIALLLETPVEQLNVHVKLVHGRGLRVQNVRSRDIVFDSKDYRRGCALAEFTELEPGTYTIICSTFEAGQKGEFTLRVDSMVPTQVSLLPREGAGRLRKTLAKAAFHGQQHMVAAPIAPKRLTKFDVFVKHAPTHDTALMQTTKQGQRRERSMIRVTIELGRGPERKILIASSNGEFNDSLSGVHIGEIDLEPSKQGVLWLVIERMFTPRNLPPEELHVEMLTDTPEAVDVGVWREWADD